MPALFDFTRFLVSSITFKTHLRDISVYFDNRRLVRLVKDVGIPKQLPMPEDMESTSTMGFMSIRDLEATRRWFPAMNPVPF